jgi:hypothetical protein
MATRSRTSFQKRQKEIARMEKQRDKAARRQQRKLEKQSPDYDPMAIADADEFALDQPDANGNEGSADDGDASADGNQASAEENGR